MPQPVEMVPQPEQSMVHTRKALAVSFTAHDHDNPDDDPQTLTVYYPINNGVYLGVPLVCVECHTELEVVSREEFEVF